MPKACEPLQARDDPRAETHRPPIDGPTPRAVAKLKGSQRQPAEHGEGMVGPGARLAPPKPRFHSDV
jgi:hypothetical protein